MQICLQSYFNGEKTAKQVIKTSFSARYIRRIEGYKKFLNAVFNDVRESVGSKRKALLCVTDEEDTKCARREHTIGNVQKYVPLKERKANNMKLKIKKMKAKKMKVKKMKVKKMKAKKIKSKKR